MEKVEFAFSYKVVEAWFDTPCNHASNLYPPESCVIISDENVFTLHQAKFEGYRTIVVPAGEQYKSQAMVDNIITQLIDLRAGRDTMILGIGGGVVTDMSGFVASIYMRGLKFGMVPTSVLSMVDASLGGKNGVDVGVFKNLVGTIRHPEFIIYDPELLDTLPEEEWISGFAEIIKHACIKDASMFDELEKHDIDFYRSERNALNDLIKRNVTLKYKVVSSDEFENGERRLLNFGHTIGHAIENLFMLQHGHAISIGMVAAANISEAINYFATADKNRLIALLQKYGLPVSMPEESVTEKVWAMLMMDKKKAGDTMNFVLLDNIGTGVVKPIPIAQLHDLFNQVMS